MLVDHPVHVELFGYFLGDHTRSRDKTNDMRQLWVKKKFQGTQRKLLFWHLENNLSRPVLCHCCLMGSAKILPCHSLIMTTKGKH